MKKSLFVVALFAFLSLSGTVPQKPVFKILDQAHRKNPQENILLSPLSLMECFGMISCGAGEKSGAELAAVLGLDNEGCRALRNARKILANVNDADFSSCNTLMIDKRLNFYQDFVNKAVYFYGGKIYKADFSRPAECADLLNELIKKQSGGMFDKVVNDADLKSNPLAVLMNVLYFKASWQDSFPAEFTQKQIFHSSADEKYQVDMMLDTRYIPYYKDGTIHAVSLPYKNPGFQMLFIMPVDSGTPVSVVTEKLAAGGVTEILKNSSDENETVIQIPVLDLSVNNDLIPLLRDAGMKYVFDPANGDLDKMVKGIPLFIDQARQLIKLKLNENGTEMAAVTIAVSKACSAAPEEKIINNFHADRPFVIVLYNTETSAVLLSGVINKPSVTSAEVRQ